MTVRELVDRLQEELRRSPSLEHYRVLNVEDVIIIDDDDTLELVGHMEPD